MKFIQILLAIFLLISSTYANKKNMETSKGDNKYKDDLKVKHSLFREKDDIERMSSEYTGIPEPKEK